MICKDCLYFDPEDAETAVCVRVDKLRLADDSPLKEDCFEEYIPPIDEYIGKYYFDENAYFKVISLIRLDVVKVDILFYIPNKNKSVFSIEIRCKTLISNIKHQWNPALTPKELLKMFPEKESGAKPTLQEFVEDHFEKAAFDVREKLRKENGNV